MKWYWAIFLTLLILAVMVLVIQLHGTAGTFFVNLVCSVLGIWVAAKSSSFEWGLLVFLLWPIGFPWFLIAKYNRPPAVT
jgi:uncharacterized membrane protein YccC